MELSQRQKDELFRAAATLAKRYASPPDFYLSLARCFSSGKCSALRYDPKKDVYYYEEAGERKEVPASRFQERGYAVCMRDDGSFRYIPLKPLPGQLGMSAPRGICLPDRFVASIHTHPAGAVFPSGTDLYTLSDLDAMCIGGKMKDGSGEYYRVLCAFPYPWAHDRRDLAKLATKVDQELSRIDKLYEDVYSLVIYDKDGIKFAYVFPPGTASAYIVDRIRQIVRDFMDVEYRVYRPGEFEEVSLPPFPE